MAVAIKGKNTPPSNRPTRTTAVVVEGQKKSWKKKRWKNIAMVKETGMRNGLRLRKRDMMIIDK